MIVLIIWLAVAVFLIAGVLLCEVDARWHTGEGGQGIWFVCLVFLVWPWFLLVMPTIEWLVTGGKGNDRLPDSPQPGDRWACSWTRHGKQSRGLGLDPEDAIADAINDFQKPSQ